MRGEKIYTLRGLIFRSFFLLAVIAGSVYFIFYSSYFLIDRIEVEGAVLVSPRKITKLARAEIDQRPNIWLFSSSQLEKKIKESFPLAESATVQKGIPDTIRILVSERKPQLIWRSGKEDYLVDDRGIVFSKKGEYQKKAKKEESYLPIVEDLSNLPIKANQKVAAKDWIDFIKRLDNLLIEETKLKIKCFTITGTTFDLTAVTNRGQIYFDTGQPAGEQIDYLKVALKNIKERQWEYLDLRVKGWAYYR